MHPHPMLLAAAAMAVSTASAAGKEEKYFTIVLRDGRSAAGQEIQVKSVEWGPQAPANKSGLSWSWGTVPSPTPPTSGAKVKWDPIKPHSERPPGGGGSSQIKMDDSSGAEQAWRPVGTSDLTMKRGTSPAGADVKWDVVDYQAGDAGNDKWSKPPRSTGGDGGFQYDMGDTGTHDSATGGSDNFYSFKVGKDAAPADKFGRVKVQFAWDACAVGAHYPQLFLKVRHYSYQLSDVTVAACTGEGAVFDYASLSKSEAR